MSKRAEHPRWKELHVDTDKDGRCLDTTIETYVQLPMAAKYPQQWGYEIDPKNRFAAFVIDDHGYDTEVRIPFEGLEAIFRGWSEATKSKIVPGEAFTALVKAAREIDVNSILEAGKWSDELRAEIDALRAALSHPAIVGMEGQS